MEELTSTEGRLIGQAVSGLREDFAGIKADLKTMSEILAGVATLQADQNTNRSAIDRAFAQIEKTNSRIDTLEQKTTTRMDELDKRLQKIEVLMPGLNEARKWLVGIGVAGLTMIMLTLASMVLRPPTFVPVVSSPTAPAAVHAQ